jgi:hypothetical protein
VALVLTIPATVPASAPPLHSPDLDNGKTRFNIGGCASCHATPSKQPDKIDRTRLGGGLPLPSPFGTFYVPNISPDTADGVGAWSEADFVTSLWKGTSPRRHLFPALPYTSYHMELAELRDLFAYLKTLPPVAVRGRARPGIPRSTSRFSSRRARGSMPPPTPAIWRCWPQWCRARRARGSTAADAPHASQKFDALEESTLPSQKSTPSEIDAWGARRLPEVDIVDCGQQSQAEY